MSSICGWSSGDAARVLERVTAPGDRRVRFRLAADQGGQFLEREIQRQHQLQSLVQSTLDALPADTSGPDDMTNWFKRRLGFGSSKRMA